MKPKDKAFGPGELVRLKSGGPVMTVRDVETDSTAIYCNWFVGGKLQSGNFPPSSLRGASEDEVSDD